MNNNRHRPRSNHRSREEKDSHRMDDHIVDRTTRIVQWVDQNYSKQKMNEQRNVSSRLIRNVPLEMPRVRLYRTRDDRSLSNSTISRFSVERHSSFDDSDEKELVPSGGFPSEISSIESDLIRRNERIFDIRFPSIEYNSSFDDQLRHIFDRIRNEYPEEFYHLIPKLIHLGILKWPRTLFSDDDRNELNEKQIEERIYFISILMKDEEMKAKKYHLQRMISDDLPSDPFSLRESLSFQGQLALLRTYYDQIEKEFDRKIPKWQRFLSSRRSSKSSIDHSTITSKSSHRTKSSLKKDLPRSIRLNFDENLSISSLMKEEKSLHPQWNEKLIVFFIEQAMILLDQSRSIPYPYLPSMSSNFSSADSSLHPSQLVSSYHRAFSLTTLLFSSIHFH